MEVISRSPRVLVVEDQEVIADLLLTVFEHEGITTSCVGTVAEALAALDDSFDFAIVDLHLPDGRGTQVLKRIHELRLDVQVAVTTGTIDGALLAAARELRPHRMFQKPYRVTDIVQWIRKQVKFASQFTLCARGGTGS